MEENKEGEGEQIINNKTEKRFNDLTQKAKDLGDKATQEEQGRLQAEKERDFYAGFSDSVAKTPQAAKFKDEIKAKVMSGYSVEDATISILHAKGELTPAPVVKENVVNSNAVGGSSTNQITQPTTKTLSEMTKEDKRAALIEAQNRGDLGLN